VDGFRERELSAERIGTLDGTGEVRLASAEAIETVFDLRTEGVTNLRG
jgi:hypothetical protein